MSDFLLGIAPAHRVPLLCLLAAPLLLLAGRRVVAGHARLGSPWAVRLVAGWRAADPVTRCAAGLLGAIAAVHLGLALVIGTRLVLGFLLAGAAAAWLAVRAITGRTWRRFAWLLSVGLLVEYAVQVARGATEADQVGLATAALELTLLSMAARRLPGRIGTVVLVLLFGTGVWLTEIAGHDAAGHGHGHGDRVDRVQAGFIQRPGGPPPTAQQRAAARELAERTKAATLRYRDLAVARAEGYRPAGPAEGMQVHFAHKGHQEDGRTLDPQAPEQLVYAVRGGRSLLLGVVFQVPVAGERGPAIGGSSTRWHAHDVCVGLLPPGFGVVSPFGTCPGLTVALTLPEMIHVWVVDPPGGPYAEHLDDAWVAGKLTSTG